MLGQRSVARVAPVLATLALLAAAPAPASAGSGAPRPRAARTSAGAPASIAVSYAELIDPDAVTRTGRKLSAAVLDAGTPRSFLQPFLDAYSSLLPYAVEMVFGPDQEPRTDVLERWPPGSPQPAWVALFRGGRYRAAADRKGRVRLFLPGTDAAAAWREHYPVVRHCLAALAADVGAALTVEIFAYRNDYRRRELMLSLRPATVTAADFPPERPPPDLAALEEFFGRGGQLEGAQLDAAAGLVLFARPDRRDSLGGEPVSLADLAVAYRAAFHAGDNDAFVSLDPNADPVLTSVNFGGTLEDTRIGAAVLAADRRFKTVCTGLDPVTHRDVRAEIRRRIPEFMTNSERGMLDPDAEQAETWVSSRYWFYPESVSVDADPRDGFAVITRPRFTADAERIGKGFEGADGRRKRAALPPSARANIRQLNEQYERYAAAFPEIGDLAAVARLMAVATWLRRSDTSGLDLDALLAVQLPAVSTPRTLERIVTTEYLPIPPGAAITGTLVREQSGVLWLTPALQQAVGEFFHDPQSFAAWLCTRDKAGRRACGEYEAEAVARFKDGREAPVRSLLRTERDLLSLLEFLSQRLAYPLPPAGEAERAEQVADRTRLGELRAELERVRAELVAAGEPAPAGLVAEREDLERRYGAIMKTYHERGKAAASWQTRSKFQVNGGISLRPGEFTIRADARSAALKDFKRRAESAAA
ncbi:MAG TPA: hypothetical protein VI078_16120, partial [bacterium]